MHPKAQPPHCTTQWEVPTEKPSRRQLAKDGPPQNQGEAQNADPDRDPQMSGFCGTDATFGQTVATLGLGFFRPRAKTVPTLFDRNAGREKGRAHGGTDPGPWGRRRHPPKTNRKGDHLKLHHSYFQGLLWSKHAARLSWHLPHGPQNAPISGCPEGA